MDDARVWRHRLGIGRHATLRPGRWAEEAGGISTPGTGSTFWFIVRLSDRHGPMPGLPSLKELDAAAQILRAEHCGNRVLLVCDNFVNPEVTVASLHAIGLTADKAGNVQDAVEKARVRSFGLVLMEMRMPVMDGMTATRMIRTLPGCNSTRIRTLTANAFIEDRQACIGAGMTDFIAKPVEVNTPYCVVLKWLSR